MRRRQMNKSFLSELKREFKVGDNKKYEVKVIMVYSHEIDNQLSNLVL